MNIPPGTRTTFSRCTFLAFASALALPAATGLFASDIHRAAGSGDLDRVRAIVESNAEAVGEKDPSGRIALVQAVAGNHLQVARFLLEHGSDANARNPWGTPVLGVAAIKGSVEMFELLTKHGADVGLRPEDGETPLHFAAMEGQVAMAAFLLDRGADIGAVSVRNGAPLHYASWRPKPEMLELLLSRGADPNAAMQGGLTALHFVASSGDTKSTTTLLEKGANPDAINDDGETPLHAAVRSGHLEALNLLLGRSKTIDQAERHFGHTALHEAAASGQATIAEALLKRGADAAAKDGNGRTALDLAKRYGHADVAALLTGRTGVAAARSPNRVAASVAESTPAGKTLVGYGGHSGWIVKTGRRLLVFDYWKNGQPTPAAPSLQNGFLDPAEVRDLAVTVFVSHEHADHFDPVIFGWKDSSPKIEYVYGFKPRDTARQKYVGPAYTYVGPQEQKEIGGLKVAGIKSLDTGGGFLVEADGLVIFHAGDHASINADVRADYESEIDYLATLTDHVDLAFLPVSGCPVGWKRDQVIEGFFSAVSKLRVRSAFPMHGLRREWDYREFKTLGKTRSPNVAIQCAEFPGDSFRIE